MATITGTAGNDTLVGTTSTDTISGLGGNDLLQGSGGNDSVLGGAGNDTVRGNDGTDWVEGGAGNDNLGGGGGQDSFVFREAGSTSADVFNDFSSGWDNIQLDAAFFTTLGAAGQFTSGDARFWSSGTGTAHDADDRIIYNTTTRQLWYDADGNGAGGALLIGTLNTGATVIASDIRVFGAPAGGSGQTINGTSGNDSLVGGAGNDTINGLGGNDTLIGNAGNDTLDGGSGTDSMDGGSGADTYVVDLNADVTADSGLDAAADLVISTVSAWALAAEIENLTLGTGAFHGIGNVRSNVLLGNSAGNFLEGGWGDDTLNGADGSDTLWGGLDNDSLVGGAMGDNLSGDDGNDFLDGGEGDDALYGESGNDTLLGGAGDDFMVLGATDFGGSSTGNDAFNGGLGFDHLVLASESGAVVDLASGTAVTSEGTSSLVSVESISATGFADQIRGDGADNRLAGANGDDTIEGRAGDDLLNGGIGTDTLIGGVGNDTLYGEDGDPELEPEIDYFVFDVAAGAANADSVEDFISALDRIHLDGTAMANLGASGDFTAGDARFFAAAGATGGNDADDRVVYNTSTGELYYDADGNGAGAAQLIATLQSDATLVATDITIVNGSAAGGVINGTTGNDTLTGTAGNDTMNGLGGNDLFMVGSTGGVDVIHGGAGTDSIEFRDRPSIGVEVHFGLGPDNIGTGSITGGGSGTISFTGVERVVASNFIDRLNGGAGGQTLTGQGGDDALWGGVGVDTLWGGGGNDTFIFRETGTANADSVRDWTSGMDKLALDDAPMSMLGATGNFAAGDGRFWSAPNATAGHDANDRVIYNETTGRLYYDADGNGGGAAQLIATIAGAPAVAATDLVVI